MASQVERSRAVRKKTWYNAARETLAHRARLFRDMEAEVRTEAEAEAVVAKTALKSYASASLLLSDSLSPAASAEFIIKELEREK